MAEAAPGALRKFQDLLKELFQFDCADLDFGIYRILNHKRDVIEQFIEEDLPERIQSSLREGEIAEQAQDAVALEDVKARISEAFGDDAIDPDGVLRESYLNTPLGKEYTSLKEKMGESVAEGDIDVAIYNHLYAFFSRYYQDGDFISKRRYSRQYKYAIPYNGEEVYLYWANHDQYYVKTSEHFRDYAYTSGDVKVHFRLVDADVEQNNVKGDKRFFIPREKEVGWDADENELTIPFEFRPLTASEAKKLGRSKQQEKILAEAVETIPKQVKAPAAVKALTDEKRKDAKGNAVSLIEHHLRQYTRRNTSDFFIHKDLKGFLTRELDFYLKNEVLNLDELSAAGEERAEGWFQMLQTIRSVGDRIITFLAQIEDFQKMLWEKRKFVTDVQYCITVGNIDEKFYPEIAARDAQWEEWKELYRIQEGQPSLFTSGKTKKQRRLAFLKDHPTLVVDTKHYESAYVDLLLSEFEDLDEATDGLVIHSENYQALRLIEARYACSCGVVFADPPYNTGVDGFPYKDTYQHSTWLSMMADRLFSLKPLMTPQGLLFLTIDFVEVSKLRMLCDTVFGASNFLADIAWEKRYTRSNNAKRFYSLKDTVLAYRNTEHLEVLKEQRSDKSIENYSNPDDDPRGPWISSSYVNPARKDQRPNLVYAIENPFTGNTVEHATHAWKYDRQTHERHVEEDRLYWGSDGTYELPRLKSFLSEASEGMVPVDVWSHKDSGTTDEGGSVLKGLFGHGVFDTPKPTKLVERAIALSPIDQDALVIDHFAGSGTTGHAVMNLNRADGGSRRFVLIEMGEYVDEVLLPRLKKITYSPDWKEGVAAAPQSDFAKGSPNILKYFGLESYEDALANISPEETQSTFQFDDFAVAYMLEWETTGSQPVLNLEDFHTPFTYAIGTKPVNLPETFQFLIGLKTRTRRVHMDGDRRYLVYRGEADSRETVVIWRETEGWGKKDLERDREFVVEEGIIEGAEVVYANGDSFIPGAKALEPVFKARMFAGVES